MLLLLAYIIILIMIIIIIIIIIIILIIIIRIIIIIIIIIKNCIYIIPTLHCGTADTDINVPLSWSPELSKVSSF